MKFISHRGAGGLSEPNSLEAIRIGDSYEPIYIEVDVNITSDGQLVLYHGELRRTYRDAPLSFTLAELSIKSPQAVLLTTLLNKPPKTPLLFDMKSTAAAFALLKLLPKYPHIPEPAFTSPQEKTMFTIHQARPNAKIFMSQPYHEGPIKQFELARRHGFSGMSLNKWWLSPLVYWAAKWQNLDLMIYTINSSLFLRLAARLFPQALICTDCPDRAAKIRIS